VLTLTYVKMIKHFAAVNVRITGKKGYTLDAFTDTSLEDR